MPKAGTARTVLVRKPKINSSPLRFSLIGIAIVAIIAIALIVGDSKPKSTTNLQADKSCGAYRNDGHISINGHRFTVEIPRDSAAFEKGLGGRPCILPSEAMLFPFNKPGQYRFWMKDMKFPIDILWINSAHKVAAQEIDVQPSTYNSKAPFFINDKNHPASYVLEMKANLSKQLRIDLGTKVDFQNT